MMYSAVRIILFAPLSMVAVFLIPKNCIKKSTVVIMSVISIVLICVIGMVPFENSFISFDTAEDVFCYSCCGDIDKVLYGEDSCMIIYSKKNGTVDHYIAPKADKGYKIQRFDSIKSVSNTFDKTGIFDIYNVKGTDDYYIFGAIKLQDGENQIGVFCGEEEIETEVYNVYDSDFIYLYLKDYTPHCYLLINGQKVMFSH